MTFTYIYRKLSYFHVFLEKDRLSFSVEWKKYMFPCKKNIVFPDNTRKIIFQCNFFGKTLFSEHLEKENMVFCVVTIPSLDKPTASILINWIRKNMELTWKLWKTGLKFQARKYISQELKYFFSIGVLHTVALLSLLFLKFKKRFRKGD